MLPLAAAPLVVAFFGSAAIAADPPKANRLFGAKAVSSKQAPKVIGEYAKGCLAGAVQLAETGPTWQAMRLSRNRNWAHPTMIAFIERLSGFAAQQPGWAGLYIGDLAQPRGGPMTSSHQSHQTGLDADIWMLPPKRLNLSVSAREKISSIPVRSGDQRTTTPAWTSAHMAIMKAAAKDKDVERIFVAAAVKIAMCKAAVGNRKWLQKIRPIRGHNTHFHVRLACPKGSPKCKKQRPTVQQLTKTVDGCDETLNWWVTTFLEPAKPLTAAQKAKLKKQPKRRRARDYTMKDLPRQCRKVLASD
jgi:penicillin-insensitive murein endopeptidase